MYPNGGYPVIISKIDIPKLYISILLEYLSSFSKNSGAIAWNVPQNLFYVSLILQENPLNFKITEIN